MSLNWSKIDSPEKFQKLANALFCSEINDPGFFQPSGHKGQDGGWDGRYDGEYTLEGLTGVYSIQSKSTDKSHKKAAEWLKTQLVGTKDIKGEIQKAIDNGVDHLRIATNAELKIEYTNELEKLGEGTSLKSLKIWYREHLSNRILSEPFIRYYFFESPQYPAFIPSEIFFNQVEKNLTSFTFLEFPKFEGYLLKFQEFITSDSKKLMFVHASGGNGKSHLLREIALNAFKYDEDRKVLFFRPTRDIKDALGDELIADKKYLIILDDAEKYQDEVEELIKFLNAGAVDIKVILSFRSAGLSTIDKLVSKQRLPVPPSVIKINPWEKEELIKLLHITSEQEQISDDEGIVQQLRNPYLIVLMANKIKNNPSISRNELRDKLINDLSNDTETALNGSDVDIEKMLFLLSCFVPLSKHDNRVLEFIASEIGISKPVLDGYLSKLVEAGILREVGRTLRFDPDMKGDMYLSHYLSKADRNKVERDILNLINVSPENIFSNIGDAFIDEEDRRVVEEILAKMVREWTLNSSAVSSSEKRRNLKTISRIGFLIPEASLSLISAYLEENEPNRGDRDNLSTDDFGPSILRLIRSESNLDLLECLRKLIERSVIGTYDNYKPKRIAETLFSPVFNGLNIISDRLDILGDWLNNLTKEKIEVLKDALSEILGATHEDNTSYGNTLHFGEKFVVDRPDARTLRNKAMDMVIKMLNDSDPAMVKAGLDISDEIGRTHRGIMASDAVPLADRFPLERTEIVKVLDTRLSTEKDLKVLNDIENLLIEWWAQQKKGAELAEKALEKIDRSPEYLILRHLYSHEYVVEDFEELKNKAPDTNRWSWFVNNVMSIRWDRKPEDFQVLIEKINTDYVSAEAITAYLEKIGKVLPAQLYTPTPLFLYPWVKINKKSFTEIRDNPNLWSKIIPAFQYQIDSALADGDKNHIRRVAQEVLANLPNETANRTSQITHLSNHLDIDEQDEIVKAIAKGGSDWSRSQLTFDLKSVFDKRRDIEKIIEWIIFILTARPPDERVFDHLSFFIHFLKGEIDKVPEKKSQLCRQILDILRDVPRLSWHDNDILGYCIEDFDALVDFIEYSLRKSREDHSINYEAIPFEGLKIISERINSYDQFKKLMDKLLSLSEGEDGISEFEIRHLIKPVVSKQNSLSGNYYIVDYIRELMSANKIDLAIKIADHLHLSEQTSDLLLEIASEGLNARMEDKVRALLFSKTSPNEGYNSTIGEPPPALVNIKTQFEGLIGQVQAGKLKTILAECLKFVENTINEHLRDDEEYFD